MSWRKICRPAAHAHCACKYADPSIWQNYGAKRSDDADPASEPRRPLRPGRGAHGPPLPRGAGVPHCGRDPRAGAVPPGSGSTNDHDLGLFQIGAGAGPSGAGRTTVGLYHLAWEVDTLAELERIEGLLRAEGALVGASDHGTTKALYAQDPDGIEFEVSWLVPADRLALVGEVDTRPRPLDLAREKARFGADTPGGIGISSPAPA
jgi:catechol 2,3-dioxygenase-like lactoylglutathione lyase family enzyme